MKRSSISQPQCTATNSLGLRCGHVALPSTDRCQFHPYPQEIEVPATTPAVITSEPEPEQVLFEVTSAAEFAKSVLESFEFQQYVLKNLNNGRISASIILRLMDYADGWGKPPERVEHTGKDGEAIVTEVRRVIIHAETPERPTIPNRPESSVVLDMELTDEDLDTPLIPVAPRRSH